MDFLNDFLREIDRARGMAKTGVVILDYFWPIIIVIGVLFAIAYIRSYLHGRRMKNHGKRIENLEKGMVGNLGQSGAPNIFNNCQDIKILQATPDVARMLMGGQQLPQPQALPPGKSTGDQVAAARAAAEKWRIEEAERARREAEEEKHKRWQEENRKKRSDRDFELVTGHPPKNPKSVAYKKRAEEEKQKVLREQAIEKEKRRQAARAEMQKNIAEYRASYDKLEKERADKEKAEKESRRKERKELAKYLLLLVPRIIAIVVGCIILGICKIVEYVAKGILYIDSRIQARKAKKLESEPPTPLQASVDKKFCPLDLNCHQDPSDLDMCLHCDQVFTNQNVPAAPAATDVTPFAASVATDLRKDKVGADDLN